MIISSKSDSGASGVREILDTIQLDISPAFLVCKSCFNMHFDISPALLTYSFCVGYYLTCDQSSPLNGGMGHAQQYLPPMFFRGVDSLNKSIQL